MRRFVRLPDLLRSVMSVTVLLTLTLPAHAIDARQPPRDLLPAKAFVSAPEGAGALCKQYDWACARTGRIVPIDAAALSVIRHLNQKANRTVRPLSDRNQWAVAEKWSLPTRRGGDCEDYALYKKKLLIEAGFPPEQLLISTVLDRQNRSHAVLVLRTGAQDLVLDNLSGRIKPWRETGYTFLRVQDGRDPHRWRSVFAGGMFAGLS